MIEKIFAYKTVDFSKLADFGFSCKKDGYVYHTTLPDSGFSMTVHISGAGAVMSTVTDPATGEPYTLHLAKNAVGGFVGGVREEYRQILAEIAARCCAPDIFKSETTKALIRAVRDAYGDEPEYLWKRFPDNAVWRRKDNRKWYGAVLTVSKRKLSLPSDETAEVLDLRLDPEALEQLVDGKRYFPGYHMNKKHWYTMVLDGSIPLAELMRRVAESYEIAGRRGK